MAEAKEETKNKVVVEHETINVALTGFLPMRDWMMITFKHDGETQRTVIGNRAEYSMADMMQLKGADSLTLEIGEPVTSKGVEYPRYYLKSINF